MATVSVPVAGDFHASDGLPHVGGDVSAITAKAALSYGNALNDWEALVRIVDAKTRTCPLCPAHLFGVDGRNLAAVF